MKSIHFETQGFHRSYWDFFSGFGFFVSIFLVLAALLAWQFGGLSRVELRAWLLMQWALALCFIGVTVLSWRYFFMAPLLFSAVISVLLVIAAWLSSKVA